MNMNSEKLSRWLAISANLGVLLGLILVAYEVNQNTQLARAAMINEGTSASSELFVSVMGENPAGAVARAYECPERMDFEDFIVVDTYLWVGINNVYRNYLLAKEGILTDAEWKLEADKYAVWYFGSGFPRDWWVKEGKASPFDTEFINYIDQKLAEGNETILEWWRILRVADRSPKELEQIASFACRKPLKGGSPPNKSVESDT